MCAVWQVPDTAVSLNYPFRSLIISPPVQPGTIVIQKLKWGLRRQAIFVTCGY